MLKIFKYFLWFTTAVIFSACGGGGSGSNDTKKLESAGSETYITKVGNKSVMWEKDIYNTKERKIDKIKDSAIDNSGNLYVLVKGDMHFIGNKGCMKSEAIIIKFDNNGNEIWSRSILGCVILESLIVDQNGNSYAVGYKHNYPKVNAIIAKMSSSGKVLWNKYFNKNTKDKFNGVAIDSSGNLYAVGYTKIYKDGVNIESNALLVKYDTNGKKLWDKTFGGSDHEEFNGIAIDKNDQLYTVGYTSSSDSGITNKPKGIDALLVKYDIYGNKLWDKTINEKNYKYEEFNNISIDKDGDLYAIGFTSPNSSGLNRRDAYFVKLDNGGNKLISYGIDFSMVMATGMNEFKKSVVDNNNDIFILGYSRPDSLIARYISGENKLKRSIYTKKMSYDSLTIDNSGSLYIIGSRKKGKDQIVSITKLQ